MRRAITLLFALALTLGLGGCGHTHTWTEATCTQPKTCLEDGVTEGEPLGHDWRAATCTQPKTCARCGETEGAALGHRPLEADYWTPSLCAVCGAELGPALPPDFEAVYGLRVNMQQGETYTLTVPCEKDADKLTAGHVKITRCEILPALENYVCGNGMVWNLQGREGYEWRTAAFDIRFDDENCLNYGVAGFGWFTGDYYHMEDKAPDAEEHQSADYGDVITGELVYKGKRYDTVTVFNGGWDQWDYGNNSITGHADAAFLVPAGYDGCIYGPYDYTLEIPEGRSWPAIADNSWLFFRLA